MGFSLQPMRPRDLLDPDSADAARKIYEDEFDLLFAALSKCGPSFVRQESRHKGSSVKIEGETIVALSDEGTESETVLFVLRRNPAKQVRCEQLRLDVANEIFNGSSAERNLVTKVVKEQSTASQLGQLFQSDVRVDPAFDPTDTH